MKNNKIKIHNINRRKVDSIICNSIALCKIHFGKNNHPSFRSVALLRPEVAASTRNMMEVF
jgi:hypothetical protein